MSEWFTSLITRAITAIFKALGAGQSEAEVEEKKCPDCGEDWDGDEIFCYFCGYERIDEENPFHPPPVRDGAVVDPDGLLDDESVKLISDRIAKAGTDKNIDLAVLILSDDLRKALEHRMDNADGVVDVTRSMEGLSFVIYNDWLMGKETDLKGCLVVLDPKGEDRVMVQGRNGPGIGGSEFRGWFDGFEIAAGVDAQTAIKQELELVALKLESI